MHRGSCCILTKFELGLVLMNFKVSTMTFMSAMSYHSFSRNLTGVKIFQDKDT